MHKSFTAYSYQNRGSFSLSWEENPIYTIKAYVLLAWMAYFSPWTRVVNNAKKKFLKYMLSKCKVSVRKFKWLCWNVHLNTQHFPCGMHCVLHYLVLSAQYCTPILSNLILLQHQNTSKYSKVMAKTGFPNWHVLEQT